jgi:hypothetical protein
VNVIPLAARPPTVTTTGPVVAPAGTGTMMLVALQLVGVAAVPLNVTALVPRVAPKFAPVIVTDVPTAPDVGLRLVTLGADVVTVNVMPLLAMPLTVTTSMPVVAPLGTGTTILVALHVVGVAAIPWNVTALVPCDAPKFAPAIVTEVPTAPDVGFRLVRLGGGGGGGDTVKGTALLASPPTVTTTLPVVAPPGTGATRLVALHVVGVVTVPLNVTVLAPCVAPKFVPAIVTAVPTAPDGGFTLVRVGGVGVTPTLTVTLLKVATVTTAGLSLLTAKPTNAVVAIGIVMLPIRVHAVPVAEL